MSPTHLARSPASRPTRSGTATGPSRSAAISSRSSARSTSSSSPSTGAAKASSAHALRRSRRPAPVILASTSQPHADNGESIVRGQVNWKLSKSHSIEFAAETAYNFLDSVTGFVRETPTARTAFFIDGSDTKVEEFRNEFQISDVWKRLAGDHRSSQASSSKTSADSSQDINYATAPALHDEREFEYPKPSITAAWRIQPGRQLRLILRTRGCPAFLLRFRLLGGTGDNLTTGGNTDLVPERTWAFNAEFEQRFWTRRHADAVRLLSTKSRMRRISSLMLVRTASGLPDAQCVLLPDTSSMRLAISATARAGRLGFRATCRWRILA